MNTLTITVCTITTIGLLVIGLITPIVLQYIYRWKILQTTSFSISIYGVYLLAYMLLQFTFAWLNKTRWQEPDKQTTYDPSSNLNDARNVNTNKTNVLVVGYREDEMYYRMCLESLRAVYDNTLYINKIYVIIDGNDPEDAYMVAIFQEIFYDNSIHINLACAENTDETLIHDYIQQIREPTFICITQPHYGKRAAMYTGFQLSLLENNLFNTGIDTVFCTDSDTVVHTECITNMKSFFADKRVGAVCGDLNIHNKYDSCIAFLSSIRYWFAFNLERAYQSFSGAVLCISGPIGMYRLSSLEQVITSWRDQHFLGKRCTYGDDRHLTNKILALPESTIYTSNAYAETETPTNFYRFYKQQIRWNKSSFREIFWNVTFLHKQSLFMTVDLIYVLVYPFVVMGYMTYILWYKTIVELVVYWGIMLLLNLIKSIYGYIMSKRPENLLYLLYGFIYITTVFPAKLWALLSINDNAWGTSSRKFLHNDVGLDLSCLFLWNTNLICGLCLNLYRSITSIPVSHNIFITHISFISMISIIGIQGILWIYVIFYISNKHKLQAQQKQTV